MDPVNFQFADPSAAILNGIKTGAVLAEKQQEAIAQQQKQQALLQQQADLRALSMNPNATHADYASVMTRYPGLAENLGKAFKVLDEGQQKSLLDFQSRVYAAQLSGNNGLAAQLLRDRAKADPGQAQHYSTMADLIEKSPETARTISALGLAGAMGPDKFADAFGKIGAEQRAQEQAPADLAKKNADATKAQADAVVATEQAKVAPQTVLLDLQKKGADIEALKADVEYKRQDSRIKAMNAAIARETNDLKRQELRLKVQEAEQKQVENVRNKVAQAQDFASTIDSTLNTIERLKKAPRLNDVIGAVEGRMPALLSDESADAIALVDQLQSQLAISELQRMKAASPTGASGFGALSEKELAIIMNAPQNLRRAQSEKQFRANMDAVHRVLMKARSSISDKFGVPLGKPDTPDAPGARPPLSSFEGK